MPLECTCEWPQAQINPFKDFFVKWQAGISHTVYTGMTKIQNNVKLYEIVKKNMFSSMFCTSTLHSDGNLTSSMELEVFFS